MTAGLGANRALKYKFMFRLFGSSCTIFNILKANLDKTSVGKLGYDTKFLGFEFRNTKDGWTTVLHKKSRKKFVEKMRTILTRRCPVSYTHLTLPTIA